MLNQTVNIKAEYEVPPIIHLAVQCPDCKNWFRSEDILDKDVCYESALYYAELYCPKCGFECNLDAFSYSIKECDSSKEVYENILRKKESWE